MLDWWNLLFIGFLTLCALPVFLQSVVLWLTNVHHLRLMWLRGTLGQGSYYHLLSKEFFRMLLVGFGSTLIIVQCGRSSTGIDVYLFGATMSWSTTTFLCLFCYYLLNGMYSVVANISHYIIICLQGGQRKRRTLDINISKSNILGVGKTEVNIWKKKTE